MARKTAKPKTTDWIKYYAKYAHIKVKRSALYTVIVCCLPCTCGMTAMWTDNAPWWDLPKRPDAEDVDEGHGAGSQQGGTGEGTGEGQGTEPAQGSSPSATEK